MTITNIAPAPQPLHPALIDTLARSIHASPMEVWWNLATSRDSKMRLKVAVTREVPAKIARLLAIDPDPGVRRSLAANSGVPSSILAILAADDESEVREAAVSTLAGKGREAAQ
ncbi:MAG: hypothetical protein IPM23_13150 [Candidatus Melainabacteria bacterium]|nr:hypothetical protein [Candidatus Melainabacteria bacterium]